MKLVKINKNDKHINDIKEIYYNAFPENERINFNDIVNKQFPNSELLGIYNEDAFIGFSFISILDNYCYIVYFAIKGEKRGSGFGSLALNELCSLYKDKTKVLCVEKPITIEDDKTKRIAFYEKNGFKLSNIQFDYLGDSYFIMFNGEFNKKTFKDFLIICFPDCENFREIIGE